MSSKTMQEAEAFAKLAQCFDVCRLQPADFPGFGRGMSCTEPVAKGDELLRIPVDKCWSASAARATPELAVLGEELLEAISDASLIALHLLVVRSQGASCTDVYRWGHVSLLESAVFETLLDWGPEDLSMLAGSKWAMIAPACRQDIQDEFKELEEIIEDFLKAHEIDSDGFLWAHRVLISRSVQFFMEDGSMLYLLGPGQDMLNHSADVPIGVEDVCLRAAEGSSEKALVVSAYRDFEKGEQAFFSYSAASNGRLLLCAGFVLEENPFNVVELEMRFPVTPSSLSLFQSLAQGLDSGVRVPGAAVAEETSKEFMQTLPPDAEQPTEVGLNVRLGGDDLRAQLERILAFFRLSLLCRGGAAPSAEELASSDSNPEQRRLAVEMLRRQLQQMLGGYPNKVDDDEAALPDAEAAASSGDSAARRKVSCLRVLIGEKRIYAQALTYLESILVPKA
eukprot:TRINITY_DN79468_c0_g1_i1.p1 TRINITY_DN79468_c0_g1~~TRINITY_DN79468_c0_g1_i1.p1  ORF type:complete len:462 (+),score=95.68 TRINITY_DN79468_c0_g1_i1:33-1388(+)